MRLTAEWVALGRPANERLAAVVAELKGGDPLAPVTVVVPSNPVGVWARRLLGARPGGVANVEFTTIDRLAHDWGGPVLAAEGRTALTDQARAAAVRVALGRHRGSLGRVSDHPSTARAVADTIEAVRRAGDDGAVLRRSGRPLVRDVIQIGDAVTAATPEHYDEVDLCRAAAAHVRAVGPVVLHLPEWLFPAQRGLVSALAEVVDVRILLGATGDFTADAAASAWVPRLGIEVFPPVFTPVDATEQRSVPDADDEARHAVRWLLARRAEGTPFHRMAICYTAAVPYRRSLHRHLEAAGITSNGPSMVTVGETIAGRFVRLALSLAGTGLRRDAVMQLVGAGPLRSPTGVTIRPTLWDAVSKKAGVVGGLDQWRSRLEQARDRWLEHDPPEDSRRARDAALCGDVVAFVEQLSVDLDEGIGLEGWPARVAWLRGLIDAYLPGPGGRVEWPEHEQEAAERLVLTLELLAGLDELEPAPTWESFVAAVDVELDRPTQRTGRLGEGVLVGPLAVALGADLDAVVIVGAIEGLLPRTSGSGVILGAAEHEAVGPDLGAETRDDQHRRYLAALAASNGRRLCLFARGDLRRGRDHYRSRWLPDPAQVPLTEVASYAAAFTGGITEPAATVAEHDLRQLAPLDDVDAVRSAIVASVPQLAVGADAIAARRWGGLSRWNGIVGAGAAGDALERVLSPTSLERYASCPFQFFLSKVLGLEVLERPEELIVVDPRARGGLIHDALEQLVLRRVEVGEARPDEPEVLLGLLERGFDRLAGEGRAGEPLHWELERERIVAQAMTFFGLDSRVRELGGVVEATEMPFGFEGDPPLEIQLPSSKVLQFHGRADRVDRMPDGSVAVVDYKTVKEAKKTEAVLAGIYNGTSLQLPVYALAAKRRFGSVDATAAYWYLARSSPSRAAEVDLDEVDGWCLEALEVITSGIDEGRFPYQPGESTNWPRPSFENCKWCDFDAICPADRDDISNRQRADPSLATFVELTTRELPTEEAS